MRLSWDSFAESCREYDEHGALLDRTLYDLCARHPGHATMAEVNAKLWIIGRTYATGIERQVSTGSDAQGASLSKVADHLYAHRKDVDAVIAGVAQITEPLDAEKLAVIAAAHDKLLTILQPITDGHTPRSFAAKYLHFHAPATPIYDSRAAQALRGHYARQKLPPITAGDGVDAECAWFLSRFWQLYRDALRASDRVTVKLLDHFLLRAVTPEEQTPPA